MDILREFHMVTSVTGPAASSTRRPLKSGFDRPVFLIGASSKLLRVLRPYVTAAQTDVGGLSRKQTLRTARARDAVCVL